MSENNDPAAGSSCPPRRPTDPPASPFSFSCQDLANLSMSSYRALVESLPLCLLIKDRDGRRLYANPAYLKYRQISADDLYGKTDGDLFTPELAEQFRQDDATILSTGQSLHGIEQTLSASGEIHWVERFKCPLLDDAGNICGVQLVFWDVTDRVRAEQLRDQERQLLQTLLDNVPDSIYFKDRDSRFVRVSRGMAEKFGLSSSQSVVGMSDADFFSAEHAEAARADEQEIMRTGIPVVNRIERETWPDREDSWCTSTKLPLRSSSNEVIGTFGISRDITELKRSQDELAAARDAANAANRAKSDFLANMSHEIRTPMNAIIGMSELLSQTKLNREQHDFLDLVREAADSLLRLLNDILDFSKIEASKMELERLPYSLRDVVGKTGQTLALRAAEKGLELACRIAPDIPERLVGDPGRLRQILINLIGNAIKFTDHGEVVVEVNRASDVCDQADGADPLPVGDASSREPSLRLLVSVRDTGIGIAADKLDSVLTAFTQADSSTTRRYGGTGLGLTISAQLAALMGGRLWLESEPGIGTTFFFTIQMQIANQQCLTQTGALETISDLPVLVVDDNSTNRRILQEVFTAWRLKPTLVDSGPAALLELDRAAGAGRPYRLAVLDCMMPDMDGFELAAKIRHRFSADQLRLILLSSAAQLGDSEHCHRVGVARYLTKPVIQSELLDAVLQVMHVVQPKVTSDSGKPQAERPLRILLAEDGLANQVVARGILQAVGHQVVIAADGKETIEKWAEEPFDVILMDMHMPELDGLEATREIRRVEQQQGRSPIPIIAVTAAAMQEDSRKCLAAGMNAFLAKPLQADELYDQLTRWTAANEPAVPTPTAASVVAPTATAPVPLPPPPSSPAPVPPRESSIDLAAAARQMPGGTAALRQLATVFLLECQTVLQQLDQKIGGGDHREIQRLAHTIKGAAKLFAATQLVETAQALEQAAAGGDSSQYADRLQQLRTAESWVREDLQAFLSAEG